MRCATKILGAQVLPKRGKRNPFTPGNDLLEVVINDKDYITLNDTNTEFRFTGNEHVASMPNSNGLELIDQDHYRDVCEDNMGLYDKPDRLVFSCNDGHMGRADIAAFIIRDLVKKHLLLDERLKLPMTRDKFKLISHTITKSALEAINNTSNGRGHGAVACFGIVDKVSGKMFVANVGDCAVVVFDDNGDVIHHTIDHSVFNDTKWLQDPTYQINEDFEQNYNKEIALRDEYEDDINIRHQKGLLNKLYGKLYFTARGNHNYELVLESSGAPFYQSLVLPGHHSTHPPNLAGLEPTRSIGEISYSTRNLIGFKPTRLEYGETVTLDISETPHITRIDPDLYEWDVSKGRFRVVFGTDGSMDHSKYYIESFDRMCTFGEHMSFLFCASRLKDANYRGQLVRKAYGMELVSQDDFSMGVFNIQGNVGLTICDKCGKPKQE